MLQSSEQKNDKSSNLDLLQLDLLGPPKLYAVGFVVAADSLEFVVAVELLLLTASMDEA